MQKAVLVDNTRVFAVCTATVKTDEFVAGVVDSREVVKEVVAPPVLTEIPEVVSGKATHPLVQEHASYFLGLAGRHPRALAELCMVDHSVSALSTLLNKGVDALHNKHYRYSDVTPAVVKELLRCALSRTCDVKKRVGRRTLQQWASHGLMRIEDRRLHMSLLFILIMQRDLEDDVLRNMKLDTAVTSATNSRAFEVFIAQMRVARGWAFSTEEHPYEEGVPVEELHHGVEWCGAGPDKKAVGHAPTGVFVAPTRYGCGCPLPKPLQDSKDANSLEKIVVNGGGAPSADVFCTLKAGASEDKPEYYNEVVQAKLSSMEGSKLKMDVNTDAAAEGDVYILISLGRTVSESDRDQLQELLPATSVGIVDDTYFGPFAPRLGSTSHSRRLVWSCTTRTSNRSPHTGPSQPASNVLRSWASLHWTPTHAPAAVVTRAAPARCVASRHGSSSDGEALRSQGPCDFSIGDRISNLHGHCRRRDNFDPDLHVRTRASNVLRSPPLEPDARTRTPTAVVAPQLASQHGRRAAASPSSQGLRLGPPTHVGVDAPSPPPPIRTSPKGRKDTTHSAHSFPPISSTCGIHFGKMRSKRTARAE